MNQLKVTGKLSNPAPPLGQELPPFLPQEALRIFALSRPGLALAVAAPAVVIGASSRQVIVSAEMMDLRSVVILTVVPSLCPASYGWSCVGWR